VLTLPISLRRIAISTHTSIAQAGSIGGGWALPEALASSFTHPLKCVEEKEVNLMGADRDTVQKKTGPTWLELLFEVGRRLPKTLGTNTRDPFPDRRDPLSASSC
jgi:hypothetical protein